MPTFDCLTSEIELVFVLLEAQRRGIPLTHVAPNFGVEKGIDYRCPDGLPGLEARSPIAVPHCRELRGDARLPFGRRSERGTPGRPSGGPPGATTTSRSHPMLQLLFGEVLADHHPDLFRRWWEDAVAYATARGRSGSGVCGGVSARSDLGRPRRRTTRSSTISVLPTSGGRDAQGQFLYREEFYSLSPAFYRAYQDRLVQYLTGLAADLLLS